MSKLEVRVEHSSIVKDFRSHLNLTDNKRILFSGPFGTGKSTFLKEFSETATEEYFYIKIFPVNYSVSQNEDVFELIKFDILFQLISNYPNDIELIEEDFTLLLKSQMFIMEKIKFMPLIYAVLGLSEKIGQPIEKLLRVFQKTIEDFTAFSKSLKIDERNDIDEFLNSIKNKKGSNYEMDSASELIFDLIQRVKKSKGENCSSVLIVDDLDRLDPEHIFRLFNIFSAHYNHITEQNKFGFDKVIFVCDIENIRKIYHHRYGLNVDFSGYIDKFYSTTPFEFDNRKFIKQKIDDFLYQIKLDESLYFYNFYDNKRFYSGLKAILLSFLDARLLNLRMLNQNKVILVPTFYYGKRNNTSESSLNNPIIVLFYFLKSFYGSFDILQIKLNKVYESYDKENLSTNTHPDYHLGDDGATENIISYCLPFILPEEEIQNKYDQNNRSTYISKFDCTIHYNMVRSDYVKFINYQGATTGNISEGPIKLLNPYEVLLYVFTICQKKNIFK